MLQIRQRSLHVFNDAVQCEKQVLILILFHRCHCRTPAHVCQTHWQSLGAASVTCSAAYFDAMARDDASLKLTDKRCDLPA